MALILRAILVAVSSLSVAALSIRGAIVEQYAQTAPSIAARAWADHPASEMWQGLTGIGAAARQRNAPTEAIAQVMAAARKAPLASEPFLVRGVDAQVSGDQRLAGRAFEAAELRDSRSVAARYFLADHYFRTGNARRGLQEIAFLARMVPNGTAGLAPYLAAYAKDSRNHAQLRSLFRSDPALADAALSALAADSRNTRLVLSLADPASGSQPPAWAGRLIATLIDAGNYAAARQVWKRSAHLDRAADATIFDADFKGSNALPPFNWTLTSSALGLSERRPGGALHVIYYGQDDGVLASQLLVLKPGRYRLTAQVSGARPQSLAWFVTCAGASEPLSRLALEPADAARGWALAIPANCPAQKLELVGRSSDMPQQADVSIRALRLEPQGG
jgi:hypothetical protein